MDLFDIIGPVMIGPSSSHTAGAARIGLAARMILGEDVVRADVGFHGSFEKTYHGHGTDRAIASGLLGYAVDDPRMRNALEMAEKANMQIRFYPVVIRGAHPNTVRLNLEGVSGRTLEMEAASIGGGNIRIKSLDGLPVDFTGTENTMIIQHHDEPGVIAQVTGVLASNRINIATMQVYRHKQGGTAVMILELDGVPGGKTIQQIRSVNGVHSVHFLHRRMG
ncbi:MAG: L-serine ammonia-lyase, iron-sulfur-dependent subunit beta [Clostridia bacterium]|nr:L-serine ammonia-lyase, iron-sulfur-dependent subunit beta [Clostridia bacterium]